MRRGARKQPRGAAAVEFALVLMPLMLIVLGTIDWGYYFYVRQCVTDAVRAGARAGSLSPGTEASVANDYLARLNLTGASAQACAGAAGSVCVRIDYPTGSVTGLLAGVMPANASAQAVMRQEP